MTQIYKGQGDENRVKEILFSQISVALFYAIPLGCYVSQRKEAMSNRQGYMYQACLLTTVIAVFSHGIGLIISIGVGMASACRSDLKLPFAFA